MTDEDVSCRYILLAQALLMWTMRTTLGDKDGDGDLDAEDIRIKDPTTGEYVTNLEDWLTAQVTKHVCTEPEKEVRSQFQHLRQC